jgi:LacI family transcriptional regulator
MEKRTKKVTLDDIAAATNLSKYSVSRAIAGKSGISQETRKKVLEACEQLGYVKKKTETNEKKHIMFIIPKYDAQDTNFWMRVMLGIEDALTQQGYSLLLKIAGGLEINLTAQEMENTMGVIFAGYKSLPYVERVAVYNKPMLILTYPPYNLFPYDTMYFSDREGAFCLCERLINMGHKKIGYYGSLERPSMKKRYVGVCEAAKQYNAVISNVWDKENYFESSDLTDELRELKVNGNLPTLIICSTDAYAQSLMFQLNNMGLEVPKDISVTGFNSDLADPLPIPLTSVGFNKREYGHLVVHYLLDRIENPDMAVRRIAIVPKLLMGATTKEIK